MTSKSSSTPPHRDKTMLKEKATAGTVASPSTSENSTRPRRSRTSSVSSINSDKATFSPPLDVPESPSRQFDLYQGHPALSCTIKLLRQLRTTCNIEKARALSLVLITSINDIVHLFQVPQDVKDDIQYLENIQAVAFMVEQWNKEISRLENVDETQKESAVVRVVDVAELTLAALERLLTLTKRMVKPLPIIPTDDPVESTPIEIQSPDRTDARMSLAQITTEVLETHSSDSELFTSPPLSDNASTHTSSSSRTAAILAIIHRARESGLSSFFRSKQASFSSTSDTESDEQTSEPESPQYLPRQSALYYPADPLHPNVDIELPPMSAEAMNITLSHQGSQMIKSSPSALIRLLTSKDVVRDPDLLHWFFTTFRFVILPHEVLDLLIARFNESMPAESMTRQQTRVWCNNQHKIVRPRVINLFIRWLTRYWEPPYDDICVLNDMQDFVLKQVAASLIPDNLGIMFAEAVKGVRVDGITHTAWLSNPLKGKSIRRLPSAPFLFKRIDTGIFFLEGFDCPVGHKVVAEQLTRLASEVYANLPAQAVVRLWLEGKTEDFEARLNDDLTRAKKRHKAIGKEITALLQKGESSSSQVFVETLLSQQANLLRESSRLASKIYAYQVIQRKIASSKNRAEQAAMAIRYFDRSLNMFVLSTIMLDSENLVDISNAIKFWFNVCLVCLELNNISCASTIYWAVTNSGIVWRLISVLPAFDSETQTMYNNLNAIFNDKKTDENPLTDAFIPRFPSVHRSIIHIAHNSTRLIEGNILHTQNLRVIGKTISAIEAPRRYVLPEDAGVESLLRRHLTRFQVVNENEHMESFYQRSLEFKPKTGSSNASTTTLVSGSPPSSPMSSRSKKSAKSA